MRGQEFCTCAEFKQENIKSNFIGVDKTNGRFGEVTIKQCAECHEMWVLYFVEYESFTKSGRWFIGKLLRKDEGSITPESTIKYLEQLDKYFYGGSYFQTTGKWGAGKAKVDL